MVLAYKRVWPGAAKFLITLCVSVTIAPLAKENGLSSSLTAEAQPTAHFRARATRPQNAGATRNAKKFRAFASSDGIFQFEYSESLIRCNENEVPGGRMWLPQDSCTAYFPICGDVPNRTSLACFAYEKGKFRAKRDFEAGTFLVAEIKEAITEDKCLSAFPDWEADSRGKGKIQIINGTPFEEFDDSEGLASQAMAAEMYRSFHNSRCYELSVRIATIDPDPEVQGASNQFRREDWDEVHKALEVPLNSFRFLK